MNDWFILRGKLDNECQYNLFILYIYDLKINFIITKSLHFCVFYFFKFQANPVYGFGELYGNN